MPNMYRDAALKSSSLGVVHCRAFPQCRYGALKVSEGKAAKNSYTEFTIKANMKVRHVKKPSKRIGEIREDRTNSPGLSVFQYNFEFLQLCSQKAFVVPGRFGRRVALGFFAAGVGLLIFRCSPFTHFPPWHMDQVLWCSVRLLIFLNLRGQTQIPTFLSPKKFKLVSDWMRRQGISLWCLPHQSTLALCCSATNPICTCQYEMKTKAVLRQTWHQHRPQIEVHSISGFKRNAF